METPRGGSSEEKGRRRAGRGPAAAECARARGDGGSGTRRPRAHPASRPPCSRSHSPSSTPPPTRPPTRRCAALRGHELSRTAHTDVCGRLPRASRPVLERRSLREVPRAPIEQVRGAVHTSRRPCERNMCRPSPGSCEVVRDRASRRARPLLERRALTGRTPWNPTRAIPRGAAGWKESRVATGGREHVAVEYAPPHVPGDSSRSKRAWLRLALAPRWIHAASKAGTHCSVLSTCTIGYRGSTVQRDVRSRAPRASVKCNADGTDPTTIVSVQYCWYT